MPSAAARNRSSTPKAQDKQWTIMVYLAGDNNLDSAGVTDLKEMKKVGSTDQINVIAQFDRSGSNQATKRYYLQKSTTLDKDAVANLGETDTGDPQVLASFIQWGMKNYPAQHYLVVIWNHGAGWDDTDIYHTARSTLKLNVKRRNQIAAPARGAARGEIPIRRLRVVGSKRFRRALFKTTIERAVSPGQQNRAIAFDDTSKDFLDNIEMKQVLASVKKTLGRKIDILGMDACLMSMAEVGYQLCDSVALTVGSEEVEPGDGWPYDTILTALAKKPKMTPQELARTVVTKYLASYDAQAGVTQAACDLTKAKTLTGAIDQLAQVLKSHLSDGTISTAILQARNQAQTYEVPDYIDLYDFCTLLEHQCAHADVQAACQGVQAALSPNGYVIQSGYKGASMQHSHGLSIYFPQKGISPLYATLDFTKQTSWDEFLRAYQNSTRRRG
ncbi:MAG: peptidase C11 [Deltaproteobacteria bacterium]|nr:peptidase C11 [Deltaproteobacteria bacterium]